MAKSNSKKMLGAVLLTAGAFLALFGRFVFGGVSETISNNIAVAIKGVRVKFTGSLVSVFGVNIPRFLSFILKVSIRNDNPVGGTITGVLLNVRYGRGGTILARVTSANFLLSARDSVNVEMNADVDLIGAPQTVVDLVNQVKAGQLKALWLDGAINTNFGPVNIDQQVNILSA